MSSRALDEFTVTHGTMLNHGIAITNGLSDPEQASLMYRLLVVSIAAGWEAFHEDLCREVLVRRSDIPTRAARSIEGFHNPNPKRIDQLYREVLGVERITDSWGRHDGQGVTPDESRQVIERLMEFRHDTAHGVFALRPSPDDCNSFLPTVLWLAVCTDERVNELFPESPPGDCASC
jgi:hypothetical protein